MNEPGAGPETVARRRGVRWSRVIGFAFGVALLAAALVAVNRAGGSIPGAFEHLREASPWFVAGLIGSILATSLFASVLLWILMSRYGRVGFFEMWALINAAWLLNYLPVRPGMFGRLAYHRAVNGVRVVDSAKALVWANVLMMLGAVVCAGAAVVGGVTRRPDHVLFVAGSAAPVVFLSLFAVYAHRKKPEADPEVWRLIAGAAVACAVQLGWAARAYFAFRLMGVELAWGGALALSAAMALASLVPITGNGLGVREWLIGLAAPVLPVALAQSAGLTLGASLNSMLVDRAAEVLIAVPLGLVCGWWALRNMARVRKRVADERSSSPTL